MINLYIISHFLKKYLKMVYFPRPTDCRTNGLNHTILFPNSKIRKKPALTEFIYDFFKNFLRKIQNRAKFFQKLYFFTFLLSKKA